MTKKQPKRSLLARLFTREKPSSYNEKKGSQPGIFDKAQSNTKESAGEHRAKRKANRERSKQKHRQRLIESARYLASRSDVILHIARDMMTYVPPIGYEAKTDNPKVNRAINTYIKTWAKKRNCDITKRHGFYNMLALQAWQIPRDGYSSIAVVKRNRIGRWMLLQEIEAERIGNPDVSWNEHVLEDRYWPPLEAMDADKRTRNLYVDGFELDQWGAPIKVHLWKRNYRGPNGKFEDKEFRQGELLRRALTSEEDFNWEYDKSMDYNSFFMGVDPVSTDDYFAPTAFEPAINKIETALRTLQGVSSQAEFWTRFAGFYKGGGGELDDLGGEGGGGIDCDECGGEGCHACGPNLFEINDLLSVLGVPEGKDFVPSEHKIDAETLTVVMDTLLSSAAFSVHLPASFVGLKGRRLQGTDIRIDVDRAMFEFRRRRRNQREDVTDIIAATLQHGLDRTDPLLDGVSESDIGEGDPLYARDITADFERLAKMMREDRAAGLAVDSEIISLSERSPDRVKEALKRQNAELIAEIREMTGDPEWNPSAEMYLQMSRGILVPSAGTPAKEEEEDTEPTDNEPEDQD